jgi:hypothetical protein
MIKLSLVMLVSHHALFYTYFCRFNVMVPACFSFLEYRFEPKDLGGGG